MNKLQRPKCKIAASLACLTLLLAVGSASAQLTVTMNHQQGTPNVWPFTPTWTPASDSLIAGLAPSTATGNFSLEVPGRNVNSLTSGGSLTINQIAGTSGNTTSTNYVSYGNGSGAGSLLIYTLPANANGYNITNITMDGGWANNGRDQQGYTILYSTVANPANFIFLTQANYNPSVPNNTPSANQVIINDALGGMIAANVAAVEFVLRFPSVENGYCGIGAITVEGTAAPSMVSPVVSITASNQSGANPLTPTWTPETPDMILGLSPSFASGNFSLESSGGTNVLTDGALGVSGNVAGFATCGASGGTTLIYTLTNNLVNGSDVTNIVVYSGWGDTGRDGQYYILSYSTVSAPTTYIPVTTVFDWPGFLNGGGSAQANRVAVNMNDGSALAHGVANIKFDFSSPPSASGFNNGYQGYSEIIVQGHDTASPPPPPSALLTQDILPASAVTVVGDWVSFSATYSNSPPVTPQWLKIAVGVTNNINTGVVNVTNNGAVTSILTLSNLQVSSSGTYQLAGLNATNGAAAPSYSTGAPLVVNSLPAPVDNVIVAAAGQTGLGALSPVNASTNFFPTWIVNTNNDLILGAVDGSTVIAGPGNYAVSTSLNGDPVILTDGTAGFLNYWPNVGGSQSLDSLGVTPAGQSLTYTLPSNPNGWDVTNITVYGGWGDAGRDEQKYQVLYSTVANPTVFNSLVSVDYLPADPAGAQSANRTTIFSATTNALIHNVYAVEFNFNNQGSPPENGWEGYSEFVVSGVQSPDLPVLTQDITPLTAEDVVGSQLIVTAAFSSDLPLTYQWKKDGTNIPGQTTTTLTLNNLKFTDTATNGGYQLLAANSVGTSITRGCTLTVDPAPTAVNNIITAFAYQTSDQATFGPTWNTSALNSSLIFNQDPPSGGYDQFFVVTTNGDVFDTFMDPDGNPASNGRAGGLPVLTDGNYGNFANDGSHPAFATCGPGNQAGAYVIYTLGANADGYNVTNIQIAGGWNDNGRDSQYYTVSYSTVANPMMFVPLVFVTNNLNFPGYGVSDNTAVRATFSPATGLLASNVYAIEVDFTVPPGVPNGYSGYSEISVFGSPSATAPPAGPVITVQHEETNNIWTVETPNLIANQLPSSHGPGVFTDEGCNVTNLTDGVIGFGAAFGASCGDDGTAVPWIVFSSATGWNLTNIVVYTLWHDYGRDGQYYNLSYSTVSAPTTFLPLASVAYNPFVPQDGRASGNRVQIAPPVGQTMLASNVYAVMFDFTPQGIQDFGWTGYSEIVLQGSNLAPPTPPTMAAPVVSGSNLIVKGTGGTPNYGYVLLTTTNLLTPLSNWTVSTNGVLNGSGAFSNAIPINPTNSASFFRLKME